MMAVGVASPGCEACCPLVNQLTALGQEKNMAKVMVELGMADERRVFWRKTQQRFETLHGK